MSPITSRGAKVCGRGGGGGRVTSPAEFWVDKSGGIEPP